MDTQKVEGWIFDCYPSADGFVVWIIDLNGRAHSCLDVWRPRLYVSGAEGPMRTAAAFLRSRPYPVSASWVERQELFSGKTLAVLQVHVPPLAYGKLAGQLKELGVSLYDADIHLVQAYHYERGHFPLARCVFELEGSRLKSWELKDDPWAIDYELPPLTYMHLGLLPTEVAGQVDPNHRPGGTIFLRVENRTYELEGEISEQLETLRRHLLQWDPDVITSDWGDSFLLPHLDHLAQETGIELPFSRDPTRAMGTKRERSFMTYGRTVYQGGARYLFGRWHLDLKNSFITRECQFDGLFEVARIAQIPVQRAARCTIGTSLSSMQMSWATRHGVLIPMDKAQAEDFRPASAFLVADKGGLCYEPDVGWHERIAEYDFTSMYPQMMVTYNISPECVGCACCPDNLVPEIGHHLCRRRRGLIPSVLEPILAKRSQYKALAKAGGPSAASYKARASAHKWILVTSFGYQGYKNARFWKIESHEAVTAWGREVLLRAKEVVEGRGLHVLHMLVDALWVKVEPKTDLEELRVAIERGAGCPLALDGQYKFLRFCPSKRDPLSGVPGRYFGAFSNGELKIRGIACRRHDTPALINEMQHELLEILAKADDLVGCKALAPRLLDVVEGYRLRLREGRVTAPELAITFTLSKDPAEYVNDTAAAVAAKQLAASGVQLHPGETVRYVIVSATDKIKEYRSKPLSQMTEGLEYDVGRYLELLERAAAEILEGIAPLPAARQSQRKKGLTSQLLLALDC